MNFPAFTLALISAIQLVFAHTTRQLNNRPVFGIITEPTGTWGSHYGDAFIAASYVKFLEMGGAQVVPIIHTRPIEEIEQLLDWLNGALFPGGGVDIATPSTYLTVVETIYNHAIQANKAKPGSFVLHGTCLGFEELAVVTANNADVLSSFNAENVSLPLDFTSYASQSKMFGNAPAYIMEIFETKPVTMNNHQEGVSPATFQATPALNSFFNVISTNTDKSGNVFLSTWESKLYPIFGTQWHPEKKSLRVESLRTY